MRGSERSSDGKHRPRCGACLTVTLLVVLSVTSNASTYGGLTMSAWFSTGAHFCTFAVAQYGANGNRPVLVVSYAATGGLPSCPADNGQSAWILAPATTTVVPVTTTSMPPTTASVTTHPPTPTSTMLPLTTTTTIASTTAAPSTVSSTTEASSTTTSAAPTSTTSAVSERRFRELANESSTTTPSSTTATTSAAPASTSTPGATTVSPVTVPQLYVSFRFTADSDERLMEQENRLLLAAPATILAQFGMTLLTFSAPMDPTVTFVSPTDPRVNTSGLGDASEYLFSFQLTTAYRYRNSYGDLLPWILNGPSAGSMWRMLAIALLGFSNPTQADIDAAAKWFPMPNVGSNGAVRRVSVFNETSEINNIMSPSTYTASLGNPGGGSGIALSFFLTEGQSTPSASTATVLACLNSAPIRAQLAAQLGGALSLNMYRIQDDRLAPIISNFNDRAAAAQQEYSKQKSYFAAGLIVISVAFLGSLMALWIWTGSGRTMSTSPTLSN